MSGYAIRGFVGANGGGKSLAATSLMAGPSFRKARPVASNMRLYPEAFDADPALYVPIETWQDIISVGKCQEADPCEPGECPHTRTQGRGCDIILDEISAALPSRNAMSVPAQLVRVINQLRKRDVRLGWTAPNWARADTVLREVTQAVTVCSGMWPDRYRRQRVTRVFPPMDGTRAEARFDDDGWAPNRLFRWVTYDAQAFDEFTYSKAEQLKPIARSWYWRSSHVAQFGYNTGEGVLLLNHLDDTGACATCGGSRSRPKCSCPRTLTGSPEAPPAAPEGDLSVSPATTTPNRHGIPRLAPRPRVVSGT